MKNLYFIMMLLGAVCSKAQMPGNWQWKNISSTTSNLYHLNYVGNSTWFASGAAGTVIKSQDDGGSWNLLNVPQVNMASLQLEHASFVSTNEGWVSNGGVVAKTNDGGATWTDVSSTFNSGYQLCFVNSTVGWKGLSELSKTTDGGTTWNVVSLPDYDADDRIVKQKMFSVTSGIILSKPGKIYKTTDGSNWTHINVPTRMYGDEKMGAYDINKWMVFRDAWTDTIWRTSNSGANWSFSLMPYYDKGTRTSVAYVTDQIVLVALFNYNTTTDRVKMARSTDGGATWNYIALPELVGVISAIEMKDANTGLAVGSNGALLRTIDGGATWNMLQTCGNMTIEDIEFRNSQNGLMAGHYGVLYTRDGGKHFTQASVSNTQRGTGTAEFNAVTWLTDSKALAMGYGGYAYYTADSGATWNQGNYTWFIGTFYDVFYQASTGKIFAGGRASDGAKNMTVSTNLGNSWTAVQIPGSFDIKRIWFFNDNLGFALGTDSLNQIKAAAWRTNDGGNTWTRLTLPNIGTGFSSAMDIHMIDASNGWMVGTRIWKTTDGGATWTDVPPGIALGRMNGVYFESASKGYITGNQGYFIYTIDGGTTWTQANLHTYGTLGHFTKAGDVIMLSAEGGGLLSNDGTGGSTGIMSFISNHEKTFVYPNPSTNGDLNILIDGGQNTISIYTISGQLVKSESANSSLTIHGLQPGMYFIMMQNDQGVRSAKVRVD